MLCIVTPEQKKKSPQIPQNWDIVSFVREENKSCIHIRTRSTREHVALASVGERLLISLLDSCCDSQSIKQDTMTLILLVLSLFLFFFLLTYSPCTVGDVSPTEDPRNPCR